MVDDPAESDDAPPCPNCEEPMQFDGFDGDYRVYTCSTDCGLTCLQPGSDPSNEGFTHEDLSNVADFSDRQS